MNLGKFVEQHKEEWNALETLENRIRRQGWRTLSKSEIWTLAGLHRKASSQLAVARSYLPGTKATLYLNQLVGRTHGLLYSAHSRTLPAMKSFFLKTYPEAVRKHKALIVGVLAIFLSSGVIAGIGTIAEPGLARAFLSPKTIESVKQGKLWTDDVLNIMPSSVMAVGIFCNNISVSFMSFAMGMLFGVGTLYLVVLNGLMLGSLFAFTQHYGKGIDLLRFITAHGPLELTLIFVASAGGFALARALLFPGSRSRSKALQDDGVPAVQMVLGSVPFFVLAGMIEGYVSPDSIYSLPTRAVIGLGALGLFLYYGFWFRVREAKLAKKPIAKLISEFEHPLAQRARAGLSASRPSTD